MTGKKELPMITKIDMHDIYLRLITKVSDKLPAFLIFDNQPFDAMRFCMPNGNDVLYFNNSDDIVDRIIDEIKNPKLEKEIAPDFLIHSLDNSDVALLYTVAIMLSDMLKIPCPQLEFRDSLGGCYGQSVGEINHVTIHIVSGEFVNLGTIRTMAHEFRHLWQYKYHPEYQEEYVDSKNSVEGYLNCLPENDAEAFSLKLMLDVFGIDELVENDEYAGGNEELKRRIISLRDKIKIDEEDICRMQNLFGIE